MTNTLLLICRITCIFLLFCGAGYSAPVTKFSNDADKKLLEYFSKQCETLEIHPNAYPDYYIGELRLNQCDIANAFDPEKFAFNYHFLKRANYEAISVIREWDISSKIITEGFGIDPKLNLSNLEKALVGDVAAYHILVGEKTASPLHGEKGLSLVDVKKLSENFDPVITELMFLNESDFIGQLTEKRIIEYLGHIPKVAHHVSKTQLYYAIWRLENAMYIVYGPDERNIPASLAVKLPHKLRLKILSLSTISKGFDSQLVNSIRWIEYNRDDYKFHFLIGTTFDFYNSGATSFDEYFLKCSYSFISALDGLVTSDSPLTSLECIKELKAVNIELFDHYVNLQRNEQIYLAAQVDLDVLFKWLENPKISIKNEEREFFEQILINHLRYVRATSDQANAETKELLAKFPHLKSKMGKFRNELLRIDYELLLENKKVNNDLAVIVTKDINTFLSKNNVCEKISEIACAKALRSITNQLKNYGFKVVPKFNIGHGIEKEISVYKSIFQETAAIENFTCDLDDWKLNLLHYSLLAGALDSNTQRYCGVNEILSIAKTDNMNELSAVLTNAGGFPLSPSVNYLANPNLWNTNSLGFLLAHIIKSTPIEEIIALPDNGVGLYAKSLPTYQWLLHDDSVERYLFGEYDVYWGAIKPYNSISNYFMSRGKYELSYFSQREHLARALNDEIYELNDLLFSNSLGRLNYAAKQASIPDTFIQGELDDLLKKFHNNADIETMEVYGDGGGEQIGFDFSDWNEVLKTQLKFSNELLQSRKNNFDPNSLASFLNLSDAQLIDACSNNENLNFAVQNAERYLSVDEELLIKVGHDEAVTYEFLRYLSLCMLGKETVLDYESLLDQYLLPAMENGMDLFDPNLLPFIMLLSDFSARSSSLVGAYASLVFVKQYFGNLADVYVNGHSSSLRERQFNLEFILTNVAKTFQNTKAEYYTNVNGQRLSYQLNKLAAAFHFPVLSYKTMDRMIDEFSLFRKQEADQLRTDDGLFDELKQYYKIVDTKISSAKNPAELAIMKAEYSGSGIEIIPNLLGVADSFEDMINAESLQDESVIFVNLMASFSDLLMQTYDKQYGFRSATLELNQAELKELKTAFASGNPNSAVFEQACRIFTPVRENISKSENQNDTTKLILLTPSVNLLPIPADVILGTFCGDLNANVILTGDLAAAVELSEELNSLKLPNSFIGLGNPMVKTGTKLSINLGNIEAHRGANSTLANELSNLPSLPDAVNEVIEISNLFDKKSLYLNEHASIKGALEAAQKGVAQKVPPVINLATHAFAVNYAGDINLPAMLSVGEENLEIITANEVGAFDLNGTHVLLSACDTAAGNINRSDLNFTGFVEAFANAGAKLISASLWPVKSKTAKDVSVEYISTYKKGGFRSAINAIQSNSGMTDRSPFVFIYP